MTEHMRYLNRLIARGRSLSAICRDPGKRADWLKYCHFCGADISESPRGVRTCKDCAPIRVEQLHHHQLQNHLVASTVRRWKKRIAGAVKGMSR